MRARLPRPCAAARPLCRPSRPFSSSLRRRPASPTRPPPPPPPLLLLHRAPNRSPLASPAAGAAGWCRQRRLHVPAALLPPACFVGLLLALWTWKCFVMVCCQNKIIYVPYLPPSARREQISDYERVLGGVNWEEFRTRAADGTDLALAVASLSTEGPADAPADAPAMEEQPVAAHIYILYLQGNASSIPPRLQDLSWVLKKVAAGHADSGARLRFTQVCLSYRGYWKSRGRPSERGINQDTVAAVHWIWQLHQNTYTQGGPNGDSTEPILVVWGQSVGSGFATNLAASGLVPHELPIRALILETPFLSIKDMLGALYPSKWIPYRYLHPFLTNHLNSWSNLKVFSSRLETSRLPKPPVFILQAGKDEMVPFEHAGKLEQRCLEVGLPVETKIVKQAYHNDALIRGRQHVVDFLNREIKRALEKT